MAHWQPEAAATESESLTGRLSKRAGPGAAGGRARLEGESGEGTEDRMIIGGGGGAEWAPSRPGPNGGKVDSKRERARE